MTSNKLLVARLGKPVGLKGEMRLFIESDFPELIKKGAVFFLDNNTTLTVASLRQDLIRFESITTPEMAREFVSQSLYATIEQSHKECHLKKDEYLWVDIVGCSIYENDSLLGIIEDIERICGMDMFFVHTNSDFVSKGYSKTFMLPYSSRHIERVDIAQKKIYTHGALDILEAS